MDYHYDGQFKAVLSQCVRVFSNFKYMTGINRKGYKELIPVPCRAGNMSRMVGMLNSKNSENVALTAPFISCWFSNISVARNRTTNPTHISQLQVNEQNYDYANGRYTGEAGSKYLVERLAPVPYDITLQVDIWTTNEEMKFQLLEQILVLFNPAIDFQTNENPLDWTALKIMELDSINYSSRSIPIGTDDALEVTTLTFSLQNFFLNPPAKVKKQRLIQRIQADVGFNANEDENGIITWQPSDFTRTLTTYRNLYLTVDGDELILESPGGTVSWHEIFDVNGLEFQPDLFYVRLRPGYEITYTNADILFTINSLSTSDPSKALGTLNQNTLPATTLPAITGVINPNATFPGNGLDEAPGFRYLILKDIIPNAEAWGPLLARAGSIIETNDGVNWTVSFDSLDAELGNVVRDLNTGDLLVHVAEDTWIHVYFGQYNPGFWQLVSLVDDTIAI